MNLKQVISIVMVSLFTLLSGILTNSCYADTLPLPIELILSTTNDLPMNDAIKIAQSAACEKRNTTLTDIADETIKANFVLLENGQKAWIVTLFDDASHDPTDISVLISSPDGTIVDLQTTQIGYFKTIRDMWQEKLGDAGAWSLEMKAMYSRLYTAHSDYTLPDETMIQQEEATVIALKEIPNVISIDQVLYSFSYNSSAHEANEQYVWRIIFVSNGIKRYQVNLSAIDGSVLDVIPLHEGLGSIKTWQS